MACPHGGDMQSQTHILEFVSLKRTRRYGAKVRTGCVTCKSRRIKCDETKPECLKCTSTGRICGSYAEKRTKKARLVPQSQVLPRRSPVSPLRDAPVTQSWPESGDGITYLEFYYHCAVHKLSNRFDNGFWSRTALQMARSEPAIRHALIALGYLAKNEPGNLKHAHSKLRHRDEKLGFHYGKAVSSLVERMARQSCSVEVGLVACLLFVCIEFLRGSFTSAFTHLQSGLKIISELPLLRTHGLRPRSLPPTSPTSSIKLSGSNELLQDTLIPMFMRSITPAMLFGAPIEDIFEIPIPDPSTYDVPFSTLYELQMSSFQLRNASALFARTMATKIFLKAALTPEDFARQTQLLDAHHSWFAALQRLERTEFPSGDEDVMAASLKLGYYSTYILIDCAMSLRQKNFDAHLAYFEEINYNAKIVLDSMGLETPPLPPSSFAGKRASRAATAGAPTNRGASSKRAPRVGAHFTFEISVIPPLHFVATRCRSPPVRRAAVALLASDPPREGLWDVETHVAVARRVIAIEEAALDPATGWPAEASRLWCSVHDGKGYSDGKIMVTFARAKWAQERVPRADDARRVGGPADRADKQWVERIG